MRKMPTKDENLCQFEGCNNFGIEACEECGKWVCMDHSGDDPRLTNRPGFLCKSCLNGINKLEANRILSILQERK